MIFYQINAELQRLDEQYSALQTNMKNTNSVCEELIDSEERLENRVVVLEEEILAIRAENNELRTYVNTIVQELNAVVTLLNTRYDVNIE